MESETDIKLFGSTLSNTGRQGQRDVTPARGPVKFDPEALDYDMTGEKILVIFNHHSFKQTQYFKNKRPSTRNGTDEDVESLKKVFNELNFKIISYRDLTHDEILEKATDISNQDHSRTSCLAVVIMTHGDKGGVLYASDRPYYLKDITIRFENGDPGLVNKPKLFFIQACRGEKTDDGRTVELDGPEDETLVVPSHVDFFYLFSNVEDHLSWRDSRGSWLMQELCKVVAQHHQDMDLFQLAMLTIRRVAYNHSSYTPSDKKTHNKKQTPEARFTLSKRVFL